MSALGNIGKILQGSISRGGAKRSKKDPAPELSKGTFDYISEPKSEYFSVGFAKTDVMPDDMDKTKYYVAGYKINNPAQGVLDPMTASAIWIDDQSGRGGVVFVSIDDIGLTNYDVDIIRDSLDDFKKESGCRSINIMSIHNHASIDTVGFWGPLPRSGRNKKYMELLHRKVKQVVIDAYNDRREGDLYYGKKEADEIQRDSRLPEVYSKDVTRFRFHPKDGSREVWMINFASHTESLLGSNSLVSADFACYLRREILEKTGAETIYFVGAIGGLIRLKELDEDNVKSTIIGGQSIAHTAMAITDEKKLRPVLNYMRQEYYAQCDNYVLALVQKVGILKSHAAYTGDGSLHMSIRTEMNYFELDGLKMLFLPCELFPELAYGGYLDAEGSAEGKSPDINPTPLLEIAQDDNMLIFCLANDFTGYVIPPNDFYLNPVTPYIEGVRDRLDRRHYEETNSLGPVTASVVAEVFTGIMDTVNKTKDENK